MPEGLGELVGEGNAPSRPLKDPGLGTGDKFSSLEELAKAGFTVFSLGPVYVYAGVGDSIPERFAGEKIKNRPETVSGTWFEFRHPVVARCENWNYRLECMDLKSYEYFKLWMLSQIFINRRENTIFVSRRYPAPVFDPFAFAHDEGRPVSIDVFTISSPSFLLRPRCELPSYQKTMFYVDFDRKPPEQDVVELGKTLVEA